MIGNIILSLIYIFLATMIQPLMVQYDSLLFAELFISPPLQSFLFSNSSMPNGSGGDKGRDTGNRPA